jgi:hypothetical protein
MRIGLPGYARVAIVLAAIQYIENKIFFGFADANVIASSAGSVPTVDRVPSEVWTACPVL